MTSKPGEKVTVREESAEYFAYDIDFHGVFHVSDHGYKTHGEAKDAGNRELYALRSHLALLRSNFTSHG